MPAYAVQRSIEIDVSPEKVFDAVSDFGTWTKWSPWLIAEPEADVTVSSDSRSVGSSYSWTGEVTGQGEVEHRELNRPHSIVDEIRFLKPFKSVAEVAFDIEAVGSGSKITWHMRGAMPWFLFWMIPSMKSFIGMDYERGLRMLKEWLETGTIQSQCDIEGRTKVGPIRMAGIRQTCSMSDVGPVMEAAIKQARERLDAAGLCTSGDVMSVYHSFNLKTLTFDFTSGFVLADGEESPSDMSYWSIPERDAFYVRHIGKYEHLGNPWSVANQHVRYRKMKQSKDGTFEIYRNSPQDTPPESLHTDIYLPLK